MPSSSGPAPQPTSSAGDADQPIRIYRIERAIALLVAIIVVIVLAVLLVGCGGDGSDAAKSGSDTAARSDTTAGGAGSDTTKGGKSGDGANAEAALKQSARLIFGLGSAEALADAKCVATDLASEFNCVPAGAPQRQAVRIVLRADGTLAERLRGVDPGSIDTADGLAKALAVDAKARGLDAPDEYACATTVRTEPDGTMQQGSTTGFLCVGTDPAAGAANQPRTRYLEPAADGTITRDYLVSTP